MDAHVESNKASVDEYINEKLGAFFTSLEEKLTKSFNKLCEGFRESCLDEIRLLKEENTKKDTKIKQLESAFLKIKKESLEQAVHDRKRNLMISDIPIQQNETNEMLEASIREGFVHQLGIPKPQVDKFVFSARHRLQPGKRGPPKVIAVLVDSDHVNTVLTAARKKGTQGQHIQTHLPTELGRWKSRCLYERRKLLDDGLDKKSVRIREMKGFSVLQVYNGAQWENRFEYTVSLDDSVNFPAEFINSQRR